ncbi:glucose 1-dehydrogenase [soil metagenome]
MRFDMHMQPKTREGTALVTGGASGLGRAVCLRLGRRGDHVIIADRDVDGAVATRDLVRAAGGSADAAALDVTDAGAVADLVARVDAEHPLTAAVICAGIAKPTPLLSAPMSDLDVTLAVNVRGAYAVLRSAASVMATRGAGAIVTICSTSSFTASSTPMIAYDLSKAAVRMMTAAAARELGPTGVRVNGVAPGTMDTPLMRGLGADEDSLATMAAARIPLGRLGRTDEVADAVAFLSSDQATYITGEVLVVDGGWLA